MALTFKYKKEPTGRGQAKRPYIPARISYGGQYQDVLMLVDSGADISFIPKGLAEFLEIPLTGEPEINYGVGGMIKTYRAKVRITLRKGRIVDRFQINVAIPDVDDEKAFTLLGRSGFFERYEVTFKEKDERLVLKRAE